MKLIRTRTRRATVLVASTAASLLALSGVAVADIVENDVVSGGNDSIVAGGSTTINYRIQVQGQAHDGVGGCNASTSSPATVHLSVPGDVTASRTSIQFTACGPSGSQAVTFESNKVGNYPITVSSIVDAGPGAYTNAADFTLKVSSPPPPANSKPSVSVTGAVDGASYEIGSEPTPGCSVTDTEDGPSTPAAVLTGTLSHGLGQLTATCDYTDQGGLAADTKSVTYTIVDTGPPTISGSVSPAANTDGWHSTDVKVSFTCADTGGSGIQSCPADTTLTGEGADQSVTGTATDRAGNTASATVSVNIDKTKPTITPDVAAPNGNGWYTSAVTVGFDCADVGGSGIKTCAGGATLSTDGANQSVTGTATDLAGNSDTATASGINIDAAKPTNIQLTGVSDYVFGDTQTTPTCTADDATSGLDKCVVSGGGTGVGTQTWTATATDNAGNTETRSATYQVAPWTMSGFYQPVDMNGVWNAAKGGSTIPMKFEMFKGSLELTDASQVALTVAKINCDSQAQVDTIEVLSSGATSLRYDTTGGQFIQNWKTPTGAGCYKATMTAADGSSISAFFKMLK